MSVSEIYVTAVPVSVSINTYIDLESSRRIKGSNRTVMCKKNDYSKGIPKQDGVALLVTDPPRANATQRQIPSSALPSEEK